MADIDIPDKARQFFIDGVESIAEWEAVLVLRRSPEDSLDAAALARQLYVKPEETAAILERLVTRGIVHRSDTVPPVFRYGPASPELDEVIGICAELYRKYLIPVTRIIHSERKTRLRAFADAFRLRRD